MAQGTWFRAWIEVKDKHGELNGNWRMTWKLGVYGYIGI